MSKFHFGENLRNLRLSKGYTQFAVSTVLGISQATYSRIESQPLLEDVHLLKRLTKVYEVDSKRLMGDYRYMITYGPHCTDEHSSSAVTVGGSKSHLTNILVIIAGAYFTSLAYDFTKSFCGGLGLSINISTLIGFSVALLTTFWLWYWITTGRGKVLRRVESRVRV